MNERIKELAEQANLTEVIDDAYQERNDWQPFVEKFAELIVRECANIDFRKKAFLSQYDDVSVAKTILEHFGVE